MSIEQDRAGAVESEIERRLNERFSALKAEFERLRAEADERWAEWMARFDQAMTGIVPVGLLAPPAVEKAKKGPEAGLPAQAMRSLDGAASQVEVLDRFLDLCLRHASRAVVLVLRDGSFSVWKGAGFSAGEDSGALARVSLPATGSEALSRILQGNPGRLPAGSEISARLSCPDASDAVLFPMVIKEKVSGALFAATLAGDESRFDPDSLGLLTFLAAVAIERIATRKLVPAPALRPVENPRAAVSAGVTDAYETQTMGMWKEPVEPPVETPGGSSDSAGRRLSGPLASGDGGQRREEARRFARLLVSEIKLYNEAAVEEGRVRGNLYARLKEEIDRSRQMYDERIPADVRAGSDFLYEELVRLLADGDARILGL